MNSEDAEVSQQQSALLSIQEATKSISAIVPILQAAYFAAISMSDLKKTIWDNWNQNWWLAILFVSPAVLWLVSLLLGIRVFVPIRVSPEALLTSMTATYDSLVERKYRLLRLSLYFLGGGLLVLTFNVVIYILYVPLPLAPTIP